MFCQRTSCQKEITLHGKLKEGAEGEVYCGYDHNAQEWRAVKIKPRGSQFERKPLEEVECLMTLNNEHCIRLHGHWVEPWDNTMWIVTEYCNGGDLADYLHSFCGQGGGGVNTSTASSRPPMRRGSQNSLFSPLEAEVRDLMAQLLMGLVHIHANCIIHRDIKLENILLHDPGQKTAVEFNVPPPGASSSTPPSSFLRSLTSQGETPSSGTFSSESPPVRISPPAGTPDDKRRSSPKENKAPNNDVPRQRWIAKIADFGSSKRLTNASEYGQRTRGTPLFSSPEMIQQQSYTIATDVWSLGVCFYAMLTEGRLPFPTNTSGKTESDLRKDIVHSTPLHPCDVVVKGRSACPYSRALGDIVMEMLTKSFSRRPTASDLLSRRVFQPSFDHLHWRTLLLRSTANREGDNSSSEEKHIKIPCTQKDTDPLDPGPCKPSHHDPCGRPDGSPRPFFLLSASHSSDPLPLAILYMAVDRGKEGIKVYTRPHASSKVKYRLFYGDQVYVHPVAMALGNGNRSVFQKSATPPGIALSCQRTLRPQESTPSTVSNSRSALNSLPVSPSVLWIKIIYPMIGYSVQHVSAKPHLLPLCKLPPTLIPSSVAFSPPCENNFEPPEVPLRLESERNAKNTLLHLKVIPGNAAMATNPHVGRNSDAGWIVSRNASGTSSRHPVSPINLVRRGHNTLG